MRKKILVCSEFHKLNTGYGVMYYEMLKRLFQNENFEIAEHATYGLLRHKAEYNIPWKFYPNSVENNDPRHDLYKSDEKNQYGQWRFDQVCLHFKPDIVFGCRDIWMDAHIAKSRLKDYYTSILAPPIDSTPQPIMYLECYKDTDYLMPLSEWGCNVIEKELNKECSLLGFGVDEQIFRPMDKVPLRQKWGIPQDSVVFGSVMRNQPRKLFPALLQTFARFLNEKPERKKNHYLYLHTSYPDKKGWNLPELLCEYQVADNVYFTYVCKVCKRAYSSLWSDSRTSCKHCDNIAASNPTVIDGLTRENLAEIYNLMDFYIQYSEKEGGGFPIVEAAACGIPVCGPNYSATVSAIKNVEGVLIDTALRRDFDNSTDVAVPNNNHLLVIMENWQNYNHSRYRDNVLKEYTWDIVYDRLLNVINSIQPKNLWNKPKQIKRVPVISENYNNKNLADYIFEDIFQDNNKYCYDYIRLKRDLFYGCSPNGELIKKDELLKNATNELKYGIWCEKVRQGITPLIDEDYFNA